MRMTAQPRARPLVLGLASTLALAHSGAGMTATVASAAALSRHALAPSNALTAAALAGVVSSCADDGSAGTLRAVMAAAISGDTIDMSGLPGADASCTNSTITLTQGQLSTSKNLNLLGPPNAVLTIDGGNNSRVLASTAGTLNIANLTIRNGAVTSTSAGARGGGCIAGSGVVTLDHTTVVDCSVKTSGKYAFGGAVFAPGVNLTNGSRIGDSLAVSYSSGLAFAVGGGACGYTYLTCSDSTIDGNSAALGGGVLSTGTVALTRCTIDHNNASTGGGVAVSSKTLTSVTISNSTISGNTANRAGGLYTNVPLTITNSTVAFNSASGSFTGGIEAAADVAARSTILASNISPTAYADLRLSIHTLTGAANLIISTDALPAPGVVTVTSDPQLVPLGNHGGPTRTHALLASSSAIDQGANTGLPANDQRGAGFTRDVPMGKPDIGAYERQTSDDEIFYSGFD